MPSSTLPMRPCWEAGVWMEVQPIRSLCADLAEKMSPVMLLIQMGVLGLGEHRGAYAACSNAVT